jgi:hypothetical protein
MEGCVAQVFDADGDGEIDYREFVKLTAEQESGPRLADLWRQGGSGWATAAVGEFVTLAPGAWCKSRYTLATHGHPGILRGFGVVAGAKRYGCLAEASASGEISAVNDKGSVTTFVVRNKAGKSTYKSEMLQLVMEVRPRDNPSH